MAIMGKQTDGGMDMKKKLMLLFVLIAAIPLVLSAMVSSYFSNQALVHGVYNHNQLVATTLSKEIDAMLEAKIKVLAIAANSPEIISMDIARQLPAMRKIADQYQDMTGLIVALPSGVQTVRTVGKLGNISDRAYFKELMKGGVAAVVSDVLIAKGTGKASVILAVPIFDSGKKTTLGVLLGVVDLDHLSNYIMQTTIGATGYAFIVDHKGIIVAHPNQKLVKEMADLSALEPVKAALSGQAGVSTYEYEGAKKLAGYSFVPKAKWGVIAQQPLDEAMAGVVKIRNTGIAFTLGGILLAALAGLFAAGFLTRPIREMVAATDRLAAGDLTVKVNVTARDELGQLAQAFNTMVDNLQNLIRGVMNTADQVAASAQELSATSVQAERAINQIAASVTDFAQGAHNQTEEIEKTLHTADQLTGASRAVAEKARTASELSGEMASAATTGGGAAQTAVDKMIEIKEVTTATGEVVTGLGEKSQQIGQILDVISEIAGQTNLLALNAAIEAARAGEQGRGFAVVAEEVRKLAEQSQEAAQQIALIVREIQVQTDQAIGAMNSGNAKVNEGVGVVQTAGEALQNILGKVTGSVDMIEAISTAAKEQAEGMQAMVQGTEQVAVIARQSSANAETTAAATEEITASMEEIAGAANSLATLAGELQALVTRFRI
ncbi:methyl-accepting chemotaxis protein [Anaeroselena agilis]|uniref:Methyl-accepting chemotaxis protein n=1 Tax=Anaeroselena agilis TaxID=3063788 RepID=A0ABU3NW06_9FIRM|nr:methyl-accepting chemotaxis protein [Selenomonadales bacterium 4137-cl]